MQLKNISILQDTLRIIHNGSYQIGRKTIHLKLSRAQMEEAIVFLPSDIGIIRMEKDVRHLQTDSRCEYTCKNMDAFTLARKRIRQLSKGFAKENTKPILVLNLANPVNPGGGVRRGAKAQEEDLCRQSSLLLSLESKNASAYYKYNRALNTYMGSDAVMIHPQVEIIKDESGFLLPDSVVVSVMTCAAPMLRYGFEGLSQIQYESLLYDRIAGMLKVAAFLGYEHLVLGAFGCGAFGNDAAVVSDLFYRALKDFDLDCMKERDLFRSIDFAVLDHSINRYNYKEFRRNFHGFYRDKGNKESKSNPKKSTAVDNLSV